jgi:thiosulfate reductase cytochrome b subunit
MPAPKESKTNRHFTFSLAKSGVRFVAYIAICASLEPMLVLAGVLLIGAEVLGIMEEI